MSKATFYNRRAKYGGKEASELKRVKELEDENRRLKNMYAELSLDHQMLKIVLGKKVVSPAEKREKVHELIEAHGSSIGRACRVVNLARSVFYYRHRLDDG